MRRFRSSGRSSAFRRRPGRNRARASARSFRSFLARCRGSEAGRCSSRTEPLLTLAQKILDARDDGVAIADLARDDSLVFVEVLAQVLHELPRAVRTLDLPV